MFIEYDIFQLFYLILLILFILSVKYDKIQFNNNNNKKIDIEQIK